MIDILVLSNFSDDGTVLPIRVIQELTDLKEIERKGEAVTLNIESLLVYSQVVVLYGLL